MTTSRPWRRLLAIPPRAASFAGLGFAPCDAAVRGRLEKVLETFVLGYNLALEIADPELLAATLHRQLDAHHVGFAFEGVGMCYALCALLAPWRAEMWCGIGVAAAYAGGIGDGSAGDTALLALRDLAGPYRADFLSGIPFATRMRQKGRNPSPVTGRACELLLGLSAEEASDWIVATVERVVADDGVEREVRLRDSYLLVRQRLVEELRNSSQGESPCRVPAHGRQPMIASF